MIREQVRTATPGGLVLLGLIVVSLALCLGVVGTAQDHALASFTVTFVVALSVVVPFVGSGFFIVNPNEAKVLQLFGRYIGSVKTPGLSWALPFYSKRPLSLRVVSAESTRLKVNDLDGNPIEIAAIVVWKVVDTAKASFQVHNYAQYVQVQGEAALRNLATSYAYDAHDDSHTSLRSHTALVAEHLKKEIQERVELSGVEVIEARISHLAYAQEIAQAMLQRQQAGAIIAARQKIVDGAVGMVEMALERLARNNVVELDEERKAAMVSNLLVVLCGERGTQPVLNTGSLYT